MMPSGFDFMFSVFPIIFIVMFVFVFGMIIFVWTSIFKQMKKDNNSPRIRVPAKVVTKRESIRRSSGSMHDHHHSSSIHTSYYATFEVESGDRMELHLMGSEYGLLVEGDEGFLTFQGSRFVSFERSASGYSAAPTYSSEREEYPFDRR
ncbi:MAG: DUF2500 domain-containing protein [Clostridia bacterium]|nr:DUF2500 domain-containing protein [Clostridia bacterium]